jgi:hypothetical protein
VAPSVQSNLHSILVRRAAYQDDIIRWDDLVKDTTAIDPQLDPHESLHRLGAEYIEFAEGHPNLYRLLFETPIGSTPLGETDQPVLYYTYYAARNALERMAAAKTHRIDPRYGAMMGWIMLHGFSSLLMSGALQLAEGMDRGELKQLFLRFYTSGGMMDHPNGGD